MSHDISKMVYVGKEPWHGLGTALPANADYDTLVQAAGFYTAVARPVFSPPMVDAIPDRKALFREDTGEYLSTVSKGYEVVQFAEVARTLVEAAGGVRCIFHTAGTLGRNGVRGWLLGELPEPLLVRGDKSPIKRYVLGYCGHDGTTAITLKNVATRVVCQNTLGVALSEQDGAEWHIPHTTSAKVRLEEAGQAFRLLVEGYERFGELANHLAVQPFNEHQRQLVLNRVMPLPEDEAKHPRITNARNKVVELFHMGTGIEGDIQGTAWAALQAFSEWADHHRHTRAVQGKKVGDDAVGEHLDGQGRRHEAPGARGHRGHCPTPARGVRRRRCSMRWIGKVLRSPLARDVAAAILTVLAHALGRQRHVQ